MMNQEKIWMNAKEMMKEIKTVEKFIKKATTGNMRKRETSDLSLAKPRYASHEPRYFLRVKRILQELPRFPR